MMKNHFTDLITSRTKVNKTPLRTAASEVHSIAVDLLVRNGANINAKDMPKMTALHRVAQRSHREVAELPLRYEADIDCLSKFHETPLDIAMDTSNTELMILLQDGIRNQINMNSDSHFIIPAGGLLNPSELITTTKTRPHTHSSLLLSNHASQLLPSGKTAARSSVQNVVGDGGRKVITGVTDQHGRLQPESPGERFIVTLQGQQSEWAITALQYTPGPN
uniref:Uncharacterized protein n=1 Tax=Sparus aurata TaxID=8175 RepID=A0A671VKP9_SPAAU